MITDKFSNIFGRPPDITGFTPGRVNLIGEHTDYNGGMVLPTALPLGITLAFGKRDDDQIKIYSDKFDDLAARNISDGANDHWSDYVAGSLVLANQKGLMSGGANILVESTLPFGAGISSSAAVTVGMLKLIRDLQSLSLSDVDIAVMARQVENDFIGMPCGIMDQMAVAIARPGQALALQTDTLEYECVDLPADYHMAVIHSGIFRKLNEGRYKERKEECDRIKSVLGHNNICQIKDGEFTKLSALPDMLKRRTKHCISEHKRTLNAVEALKTHNISALGRLMSESHTSMRDDFEITVPAIDELVHDAIQCGALGARMTGGGFGGCIVACVQKSDLADWQKSLLALHEKAFVVC